MNCPKCQQPNVANARFCQNCGALLPEDSAGIRGVAVNAEPGSTVNIGNSTTATTPGNLHVGECPICGRHKRPEETFRCKKCQRDLICLDHQDKTTYWCISCAADQKQRDSKLRAVTLIIGAVGMLGALIAIIVFSRLKDNNRPAPVVTPTAVEATRMAKQLVVPSPTPVPPAPTSVLDIGSKQVSDQDGMTLLYVPAGEFTMGSNDNFDEEKPSHKVYLDAFWIDRTEVTNAMFQKFVATTGYKTEAERQGSSWAFDLTAREWKIISGVDWQHPRGPNSNLSGLDNHPVVQVSWNDATAYCQWASRRLPTEAQWEKAARGNDERIYPWGNATPDATRLNFNNNIGDTTEGGLYPTGASPYGALDMAGNVWEWVADWYSGTYYTNSPARNPTGPTVSDGRVLRGGGWGYEAVNVRVSFRGRNIPNYRFGGIGFRCAR